ncbi:peptidylprolyl isomerase [Shewanella waksmanii]|uniref:peptidylprolyl isomerase n=1 Tax=Shewanella waksmanii TaxID=213783 RepID=UPI0037363EE7
MNKPTTFGLLALMLTGLAACGGGSGSSDSGDNGSGTTPPPTPAPSLSLDQCFVMTINTEGEHFGELTLGIDTTNTPVTGNNFIDYVEEQFYDGTLFHRVLNNFVIQAGGFTAGMEPKEGRDPIVNEASVGLSNERGTLSMARTSHPDSATSQFFINTLDNPQLDYSASAYGYAVFGQVIEGMDVVDQISIVNTHSVGNYNDVPIIDIEIASVVETNCPQ